MKKAFAGYVGRITVYRKRENLGTLAKNDYLAMGCYNASISVPVSRISSITRIKRLDIMGRPRGIKNNSGGISAPRRDNGNINWDEVYSPHIVEIISEQIAPNTLRGIMYILKSKNILKKSDYNGLITHFRDWRKDGKIKWHDIVDGSGRGVINDFSDYEDIEYFVNSHVNFLRNGGHHCQQRLNKQWRWYGQPNYIEIWCEKHAIAGTVRKLVDDRYVRVAYNKGDPGWGYMYDNCQRLKKEMRILKGREIYIFYLGDHDKYGLHMDEEIKEQLQHFGLWDRINFERIGVLPEQIEEYDLPENFDEEGGYEVDALNAFNPQAFKELIHGKIDPLFDKDIHTQILAEHPAEDIDNLIRSKVEFLDE
jgi:hypothetical protein